MNKFFLGLMVFNVCFSHIVKAQTHTFIDANGDGNWHNSANWDAGTVPTASSTVLVLDGFEVSITSQPATAQSISLQGASLLEINNTLTLGSGLNISLIGELRFKAGTISGGIIANQGLLTIIETTQKIFEDIVVENNGRIRIVENASIEFNTDATLNITPTGILEGNGTLDISGIFNNQGTISPGGEFEIGALFMNTSFSIDNGVLLLDIIDATTHDLIKIIGGVEINGAIELKSENIPDDEFFTVTVVTASQGVHLCDLPAVVTADNDGGIIMSYNVLCEPNSVSLELFDAFIFSVDEEELLNSFSIIPNPSTGATNFTLDPNFLVSENTKISITNLQGQEVAAIVNVRETNNFEKNTLQNGIYFVSLIVNSKKIGTKKLVVL